MLPNFILCDTSQTATPDEEHPFIIFTKFGQPVKLLAYDPFAGTHPPPNSKTAVILVAPENLDSLVELAKQALVHNIDAEGVILVDKSGHVHAALPTDNILLGFNNEFLESIQKKIGYIRGQSEYGPLLGVGEPDIPASFIYSCPTIDCASLDWVVLQKGMEIPPCPIHNTPRILKKPQS